MRPVVVTAVLLLVVLMSMSASADWNPDTGDPGEMCRTQYQYTPCTKNMGEGWNQFGADRCVKAFPNQQFTHSAAEKACRWNPGGDLVSIHSHDELNHLICIMYRATTDKPHYWIGLYQESFEDDCVFRWSDGSDTYYTNWAVGEPRTPLQECVEINFWHWGQWNDLNCGETRRYVCQVKL